MKKDTEDKSNSNIENTDIIEREKGTQKEILIKEILEENNP